MHINTDILSIIFHFLSTQQIAKLWMPCSKSIYAFIQNLYQKKCQQQVQFYKATPKPLASNFPHLHVQFVEYCIFAINKQPRVQQTFEEWCNYRANCKLHTLHGARYEFAFTCEHVQQIDNFWKLVFGVANSKTEPFFQYVAKKVPGFYNLFACGDFSFGYIYGNGAKSMLFFVTLILYTSLWYGKE